MDNHLHAIKLLGKSILIQKIRDKNPSMNGWRVNERYEIFNDGIVYDTHKGLDIPKWIFELRDFLLATK